MKRITMRDTISKVPRWFLLCWRMCTKDSCERCDYMSKVINRLGEIEDILGEEYDLEHLRKLVKTSQNKKVKLKEIYTGYFGYKSNEPIEIYGTTYKDVEIQYGACGRRESYKCPLFTIYDKKLESFLNAEYYYFDPWKNI